MGGFVKESKMIKKINYYKKVKKCFAETFFLVSLKKHLKLFIVENKVTIKENDAFHVLTISTGLSYTGLKSKILWGLKNEGIIHGGSEDCGMTVEGVAMENGYSIDELVEILFPGKSPNQEINELLKSVFIWGTEPHGCPDCGCEVETGEESQYGHTWKTYECSNCEYSSSDEPDWDIFNSKL